MNSSTTSSKSCLFQVHLSNQDTILGFTATTDETCWTGPHRLYNKVRLFFFFFPTSFLNNILYSKPAKSDLNLQATRSNPIDELQ